MTGRQLELLRAVVDDLRIAVAASVASALAANNANDYYSDDDWPTVGSAWLDVEARLIKLIEEIEHE